MRNVVHFGSGAIMRTQIYPWEPADEANIATLADSWSVDNQNDSGSYQIAGGSMADFTTGAGQAFTSQGGKLASAKFSLRKFGSPTFNLFARLYAATGAFPAAVLTGAPLAQSDSIPAASIATATDLVGVLYEFMFSDQFEMLAGTKYVIAACGDASAYDSVNKIGVGVDFDFGGDPNPGHYGNYCGVHVNSGASLDDLADCIFYIYTLP